MHRLTNLMIIVMVSTKPVKDIVFKTVDNNKYQYAEVLVNGKTGSRHIPLIQSIPYIKDWLSNHPRRNNPNSPIFVGLGRLVGLSEATASWRAHNLLQCSDYSNRCTHITWY
jgi:hypothetical protein